MKKELAWNLLPIMGGVALIAFNASITSSKLVILSGFILAIVGVINFATNMISYRAKASENAECDEPKKTSKFKFWLSNIACDATILLGIILAVSNSIFVPYVPVVLGLIVLICTVMMFYTLAIGVRPVMLPAWMFLFPVLTLVASVMIYFQNSPEDDARMLTITGVALCIYGLCNMIACCKLSKLAKQEEPANENADE